MRISTNRSTTQLVMVAKQWGARSMSARSSGQGAIFTLIARGDVVSKFEILAPMHTYKCVPPRKMTPPPKSTPTAIVRPHTQVQTRSQEAERMPKERVFDQEVIVSMNTGGEACRSGSLLLRLGSRPVFSPACLFQFGDRPEAAHATHREEFRY